jgi:L-alanine-DL-glutamate epimerase-like enolase superfamily enzyme
VKIKVGGDDDFARAAVVRDAVGPSVALRLDANGAWDAPRALDRLRELAPLGIELCEQPTPDLLGLAAAPVPIAADELVALDPEAAFSRAQVVVLKPMLLGGILRALELARRAVQRGLRVIVTTSLDGAIARAGAAHLAAAVLARGPQPAAGLATGRLLESDLCPDTLAPRDGVVRIPDQPGLL